MKWDNFHCKFTTHKKTVNLVTSVRTVMVHIARKSLHATLRLPRVIMRCAITQRIKCTALKPDISENWSTLLYLVERCLPSSVHHFTQFDSSFLTEGNKQPNVRRISRQFCSCHFRRHIAPDGRYIASYGSRKKFIYSRTSC